MNGVMMFISSLMNLHGELPCTTHIRTIQSRANLLRPDLRDADLEGACLRNTNLSGADWGGANREGADFERAVLPDGTKHD